ncbi:hypothetical protein [Nostoc sp.]|uniref:hypothetical protein n=1 Tax=Nostoc sp. TaxID=1180 RepID=UPI003594759B
MAKINRKFVKAITTVVTFGWVIMQLESAQAATLAVNNLNDSGVGSLRDTISIANSNDVVEFFLGSNPSTITLTSGALAIANTALPAIMQYSFYPCLSPIITFSYEDVPHSCRKCCNLTINGPGANFLTISGNNQFSVFDISAANVTFSGLTIAGNINGYDSSNVTFTDSSISGDNVKIDNSTGNLTFINSTITSNNSLEINASQVVIDDTDVTVPSNITIGGNSGQINSGSNNSGSGGNITITSGNIILTTRVSEPSAIAGSILAGSLAWLAKRKQAAFRKAKV